MPTYTPSSGTIRFSDIRNAFGLTTVSLAARRSQIYWRADAFRGTFSANTIKLSDFYAKSGTSPVTSSTTYASAATAGSPVQGATYTSTYTVPLYYQMKIDCRAAGGGGAGGDGAQLNIYGGLDTGNGAGGTAGENTSFGSFNTAFGGSGGVRAAAGTRAPSGAGSDNIALGGNGGGGGNSLAGGGAGGNGGFNSVTVLSPVNGGSGPAPGSVITVTVGKGGYGGAGFGTGSAGSPGRYGEFAVYIS